MIIANATSDLVQKAYIAFYGRPADTLGLSFWGQKLEAAGGNLGAIIDAFGNSTESQTLYGASNISARINKIYRQEFNRAADTEGLQYWTGQIEGGQLSLASAALAILNGADGSDKAIIENKLLVANAFTNALTDEVVSSPIVTNRAANARAFLATISADSALADKLAGIADEVAQHIDGSISADLALIGVQLPAEANMLNWL